MTQGLSRGANRGGIHTSGVSGASIRADVSSRSDERIYYNSRDDGRTFFWSSDTYDYDAADTILLIKNTSSSRVLVIREIDVSTDTVTLCEIHTPTTVVTTPTGTAITGTNANGEAPHAEESTAIRDETTNAQGEMYWNNFIPANSPVVIDFHDAIRLKQNQSIAIDLVTAGTGASVVIDGFFETGLE